MCRDYSSLKSEGVTITGQTKAACNTFQRSKVQNLPVRFKQALRKYRQGPQQFEQGIAGILQISHSLGTANYTGFNPELSGCISQAAYGLPIAMHMAYHYHRIIGYSGYEDREDIGVRCTNKVYDFWNEWSHRARLQLCPTENACRLRFGFCIYPKPQSSGCCMARFSHEQCDAVRMSEQGVTRRAETKLAPPTHPVMAP